MTAFRDAVVFLLKAAADSRHGDIDTERGARNHLSAIAAELKERELPMPSGDSETLRLKAGLVELPGPKPQAPLPGDPALPVEPPASTESLPIGSYIAGVVDELKK